MPNIRSIKQLIENKDQLALAIFTDHVRIAPEMAKIKAKYLEDTNYTLRFLIVSIQVNEPLVFENYMKWFGQFAYYMHFRLLPMIEHFEVAYQTLEHSFEPTLFQVISTTWNAGVKAFKESFHYATNYKVKIDVFLQHLLDMNIDKAYEHILNKMDSGLSLKEVYLQILQPTLYQVGDLWQQRIITVAKEHYITAAIQHIIGKLYGILFSRKQQNRFSMTAVCAGSELHEIGMRMVADIFELSGWDTVFLGSNIPVSQVVAQLKEHPTDLLAISATNSSHLVDVLSLISLLKAQPELKHVKVIVGGRSFNEAPNLWKKMNADGFASDAEQAVLLGELLVGGSHV